MPTKKTKPAPAKKPLAKSAKSAPAKKPAAQPKPARKPAPAKKHQPAKPAPAKHHPPKAPVPNSSKPSASKSSAKPEPAKKVPAAAAKTAEPVKVPAKSVAPKVEIAAKAPAPKSAPAKAPAAPAATPAGATKAPAAKSAAATKAANKADALRARILERRSAKPIAFSLDEVREIAKVNVAQSDTKAGTENKVGNGKPRTAAEELEAKLKKAAQPNFVQAASLADILGYNPVKQASPTTLSESEIDPKFLRYYRMLVDLRGHVATGLNTHTEETLKRSAKDDAGDLSSYGQHMADAGTDTFDRDFALSLVSNEQEALAEIEAAIQRIKAGTYGVCELTGKPISKDRLLAVPFARFSVESQTEVERTKRRSASRAGLLSEGEDGGKFDDDSGGGGDE